MLFISELVGKPVFDGNGERIGTLSDLVARFQQELPHPVVVGITIKCDGDAIEAPYSDVEAMIPAAIYLNRLKNDLRPFSKGEQDFYLVEDVLDQQIIDTSDARVVRANDLELMRENDLMVVSHVDIGIAGILRRIGLEGSFQRIAARMGRALPRSFISLNDVELLPHEQSLRISIRGDKITGLHPADLAEIIGDLNRASSDHILEALDAKSLAETLEEVEPDFQASLVRDMSDEKVADVLEEMSPDEAADLLAELPKERSDGLLKLMDREDSRDLRKLLTFPESSAGGIMTTDYVTVPAHLTAEQVIAHLRATMDADDLASYIYVVDADNLLIGVLSLSDLILAQPGEVVADFMDKRVISVHILDEQEKVAQVIAKYNLLAVPVIDHHNVLHGIVTADDALDVIIPSAWKKRLPRMYH